MDKKYIIAAGTTCILLLLIFIFYRWQITEVMLSSSGDKGFLIKGLEKERYWVLLVVASVGFFGTLIWSCFPNNKGK